MADDYLPADLPHWESLTVHVTDPTKKSDFMVYKVSIREEKSGTELFSCWRRFREFEEAFKALRVKGKELGLPQLPEPPPKKAFGRFDPKFVEERRRQLEDFLCQVKDCKGLRSSSEFQALLGLFGGGGYLRKLGARTVAFKDPFKLRWFEIRSENFHYYERQGGKRLGTINLKNTKVVDCTMYRHAFCLMGPLLPRTYVLTAESEKDKQRWWKHLEAVTMGEHPGTRGIGELEGVEDAEQAQQYYVRKNEESARADGVGSTLGLKDFDLVCVVGIGSFGKVMKVKHRDTGTVYAMKVLNKDQIIQNKMVAHTNAEKMILEMVNHPFVVNLHFAFQTKKQLIFILDFLSGGELFYHLQRYKRFSESRARFYTAEIALALSHLHSLGVIYRDLKPENLVLDGEGHVMLTDFGLAKTNAKGTTYTFCGTPEYMAPELVMKQGHTQAVDWWSLGIFLYEMVVGIPPFYTQNVSQMYQLILNKPLEFPSSVSAHLRDVLTKLLDRDPKQRLCDVDTLKAHPFFKDVDFEALYRRELKPEFVPSIHQGESDTKYFDTEFTQQATDLPGGDDEPGGKDAAAGKFDGFSYASPKALS
ncbi:RAC family serine/threonine-protein kinase-like protein [Diplonema papillatum]|nr:RAC family serine/threonine-protein kinase-like protein [Diplonema papillatum]